MTPIERLRALARDTRAQYGTETAAGGEPAYPAWVDDVAAVCDELERLRALGGEQAAPQKAEPSDEEIERTLTKTVRAADARFQKVGGTSRHWVRDFFLPILREQGLIVARYGAQPAASVESALFPVDECAAIRSRSDGYEDGTDAQFHYMNGYRRACTNDPRAAQEPAAAGGALDEARLNWFFGSIDKSDFILTYMQGMREKWTPDQWRAAMDAAMQPTTGSDHG